MGLLHSRPAKPLIRLLGGPARARVVLPLSFVLALNTADGGLLGALGGQLEAAMGIDHTRFGIVVAAAAAMGVLGAPIAGTLADRTHRVTLLTATIVVWGVTMALAGLATGYWWLLASRIALGAALAAAGPVVTSLVGDYFQPSERARAYGWILTGELVGAGTGLATGVVLGSLVSWRVAFFAFGAGSLVLAGVLRRILHEPRRGGASWIADPGGPPRDADHGGARLILGEGVAPAAERVLHTPAGLMSLPRAAAYVLSIPSVRRLVIASAVGYFFFAGLRAFAIIFATHRYGLPATALVVPAAIIGAVALLGTVTGGRLSDLLLKRRSLNARLMVAAGGYLVAVLGFAPALLTPSVPIAVALFALAAAGLAGANPPLDAARLDIVPAGLWGRAESVRTMARLAAEAIGPVLFGITADHLGGRADSGTGLRNAFLVMLVPLAANGALITSCRPTYATDTATAAASDRAEGA